MKLPFLVRPSPPTALLHEALGRRGERIGAAHLKRLGYSIVGRNIRMGQGEIDLLAYDPADRVLVFAEVKTRREDHPDFRPELNLTERKRSAISRAARAWVRRHEYNGGYRLDLLCVAGGSVVNHVKEIAWSAHGARRT